MFKRKRVKIADSLTLCLLGTLRGCQQSCTGPSSKPWSRVSLQQRAATLKPGDLKTWMMSSMWLRQAAMTQPGRPLLCSLLKLPAPPGAECGPKMAQ